MQSLVPESDNAPTFPSLQFARPRLKSGQLFAPLLLTSGATTNSATSLIFELTDGSRHVLLPPEAAAVLPLLDGTHTLPDIFEAVHRDHGPIAVKTIFDILQRLQAQGAIEGVETLVTAQSELPNARRIEFFEQPAPWFLRSIWSALVAPVKDWGEPSVPIFGLFALVTFLVTLAFVVASIGQGFIQIPPTFLRFQDSYIQGLIFFFVAASVVITTKTVVKTLLTLFLTGSRSALRLELNLLSFALRSDDDKVYLVGGRLLGTLAFAAVVSSYFFIFAVARAVAPQWPLVSDLFLISTLIALAELNPFRKSDLSSFFSLVLNRKGAIDLASYLEYRLIKTYRPYIATSAVWLLATGSLLIAILNRCYPSAKAALAASLESGNRVELLALGIGTAALALGVAALFARVIRIVIRNTMQPLQSRKQASKVARSAKPTVLENVEMLAHSLASLPLLAKLHQDARVFLLSKGLPREIPASKPIIAQGAPSSEFQLLIEGSVLVQRHHASGAVRDLALVKAPAVLGENTLLAGLPHTADIIASTDARTIAIPRKAIDELAHHTVLRTEAEPLLDRLMVGQFFSSSALFRNVPSEVASLILNEGEIVDIATGRHIVEQGRTDQDFYVMIRGSADVLHNGQIIAHILAGEVFGEEAMVFHAPRFATIMTREPSRLLKVSSRQFWNVLSKYPALALRLESVPVAY